MAARFVNGIWTAIQRIPWLARVAGGLKRLLGVSRMQVFSITVYGGDEPWSVAPIRDRQVGLLTRRHVTDVPAAFVADPFLHRTSDGWTMFFEVLRADTWRGEIGMATSQDGLRWRYGGIVLAEPFHLSYPHVVESNGVPYLIPETSEVDAVRLYRADPFPSRWVFERELLVGAQFADASPFFHDGWWWMFVETSDKRGALAGSPPKYTLRLYGAPTLPGPWTEHPSSPIVVDDARTGRPAGRVVTSGGRLIRFAQEGSEVYGLCVHAIEIESLSPDHYRERQLPGSPLLGPGQQWWNRGGMHHVDAHAVDGAWLASVDGWSMQLKPRTHGSSRRRTRTG